MTSASGASLIAAALDAMGGEAKLRAIRTMHYKTTGVWTAVESSPRPEPPWNVSFSRSEEWLDFERGSWARDSEFPTMDGKTSTWQKFGVIAADGASAMKLDGETRPGGPVYLGDAEEQVLYQPFRLLLAAADAKDLRVVGRAQAGGQPADVVAFHRGTWPVKLWIHTHTHRLAAAEITHTLPDDFFWRVRGDVVDRFEPAVWTLDASGVWFARQYSLTRNGILYHTFVIDELDPNGATPERFAIDEPTRAAYRSTARGPAATDAVGDKPLTELAPGLWHVGTTRRNALVVADPAGAILIDAPISEAFTARILAQVAARLPAPATQVVLTDHIIPTLSGLREAAARGLTLHVLDANIGFVTSLLAAPHTLEPDALARANRRPVVQPITARTRLGTGATALELIPLRSTLGERAVLAWFPASRILWTATALSLNRDGRADPSRLAELDALVAREHLDVDRVIGAQLPVTPWASLHPTAPR